MSAQGAEIALPEPVAAQRRFTRACDGFAEASFIHDLSRANLATRLDYLKVEPKVVLDLGCGPGAAFGTLRARFPTALLLGVDANAAMCRAAARTGARVSVVRADAAHLPLAAGSVGLILANLVLPWCLPDRLFAEAARVLSEDGLLLFATLGPDSLEQVRRAWAAVDDRIHVHAGFDMHDLGDLAARAGLTEPVLDVDRLNLSYASLTGLVRDLRGCGASNSALGRRKSLTGPRRWRQFAAALARNGEGTRLNVTVELIYGQAWGPRRGPRRAAKTVTETVVPVTAIQRR